MLREAAIRLVGNVTDRARARALRAQVATQVFDRNAAAQVDDVEVVRSR